MTRDVTPLPKTVRAVKPRKAVKKKRATTAADLKRAADKAWGTYIHQRDRGCRFCDRTDGKLDAHHICVRTFAATRCDPNNGLLLCFHCHQNIAHGDPFAAVWHYERILGHNGYQALREKAYSGVKANKDFWADRVLELAALLKENG